MKGRLGAAAAALIAAAAGGFGAPGTFGNLAGTFAESARANPDRPGQPATPAEVAKAAALRRVALSGAWGGPPSVGGYRNLAGWTNRRYQRAALKLRNQKRNRKHHHG